MPTSARTTNVAAIVSFVCGLISIFLLPVLLGVFAFFIGVAGLFQIASDEDQTGAKWAWLGILLGCATIVLGVIGWIVNDGWSWSLWGMY